MKPKKAHFRQSWLLNKEVVKQMHPFLAEEVGRVISVGVRAGVVVRLGRNIIHILGRRYYMLMGMESIRVEEAVGETSRNIRKRIHWFKKR